MRKRRILGITAIRSEYFLQRPIFRAIEDHADLELGIVVTGAHLSSLHGHTVKDVERDGFRIVDRIDSLIHSDHDADRLSGAAKQLQRLVEIVDQERPDWLLAPADREEAMTMSLCGAYLGLPTAHYAAGDRVVGNVDDMVRHAVSRLSHLLMTTNEDARQRLIRAGEEEWRVHTVGHSGIDRLRSTTRLTAEELAKQLDVGAVRKPYLMVIQHPLSSQIELAGDQMRETMAAIKELGFQTFVSYPNSDPGSKQIIEVIEQAHDQPNIHTFKNIPDVLFVNLLRGAAALIGNSSLGLLEAPYLKLPVINVGKRQTARQHSTNVFFVPHEKQRIVEQIRAILEDEKTKKLIESGENIFGDGHAGERVAELLAATAIDGRLLNKDLSY
jgi:GDP/UDP-N,N'-diacetylbacillosamine 2-epimerase (hydrolysing)